MSLRQRPALLAGLAVGVAVVLLVVALTRSRSDAGESNGSVAGPGTSGTTVGPASGGPGSPAGVTPTAPGAPAVTDPPGAPTTTTGAAAPLPPASTPEPTVAPDRPRVPASLPVTVTVSNTSGLRDGQTVNIHAVPAGGSQVYGVEARICAADRTIDYDADFRPTQTGNCIVRPLSASSDAHVTVAAPPPYQSVDVAFKVGTGTSSYTTQAGQPVQITCGPGNPCQLVLKLQIPNGFGFQAYPLSFG